MTSTQLFCLNECIDWAEVRTRTGGDSELVTELLTLFLEDAPQHLVRMQSAIERDNGTDLARSAHALKGSAAVFALKRLIQLLEQLEVLGSEGRAWGAMALFGEALDEMSRMAIVLKRAFAREQ